MQEKNSFLLFLLFFVTEELLLCCFSAFLFSLMENFAAPRGNNYFP